VLSARDAALEEQMAQATELLASVQDPAGWRTRSMRHLLDRLARDRAFVAELVELAGRDGAAR